MSFANVRFAFETRGAPMTPRGDGFKTVCPAHDDQNASLSVSPGDDGRTLVRCYAGCKWAAIVEAVGLPKAEWFPPPSDAPRDLPAAFNGLPFEREYAIRAADGSVVARHARFSDGKKKLFAWFWPNGEWSGKPTERQPDRRSIDTKKLPLYGAHDLPPTGVVVVTEGEKDCDALRARGVAAVGTVCGAASLPCDESLAVLKGRDVVLWPDHDSAGVAHMARIAVRLDQPPRVVAWDEAEEGDGAADWKGDDASLLALLSAARSVAPPTGGDEAFEPHTDLGVARRFLLRHGDDFRCADGRWLRWNGTHWERGANAQVVAAMAAVARSVVTAAGGDDIAAKAAQRQEGFSRINGAASLAAVHEPCRIDAALLDRPPHLLACKNVVVDLRTGRPAPVSRQDLLSRHVPHDFDPNAKAPRFESFLREVCAERDELVGFVRRFCGYGATGETREHALLLATGKGRNGKSTLFEAVQFVLGEQFAAPAAPGLLLATKAERHPTEIMDLQGRRLVVASEVPKQGAFSEERVKWLTGGDTVKARGMRADFSSFRPTHKFVLCANHFPTVRDPTEGFWRRVRVVPFDVDFRGREERGLPDRLRAEAPGILAWIVRAAVEWYRDGLGEPLVVRHATAEYRTDEDVLGRFLAQWMPGSTEERPASQIFAAFKAWCAQEGEAEPRSAKALAADLTALGWAKRRTGGGMLWRRADASAAAVPEAARGVPEGYPPEEGPRASYGRADTYREDLFDVRDVADPD